MDADMNVMIDSMVEGHVLPVNGAKRRDFREAEESGLRGSQFSWLRTFWLMATFSFESEELPSL